ncbi:uncharacterized protein TNCV_3733441 [Trichonephila clavipes]|nr:uncharacterized protein TNCV_3733441 [Trichonephila clavipes]
MPIFDVPTRQESKVLGWDSTPTVVKSQRAMKKVMYAIFYRSMGLIKAIKLEGEKTITANWYNTKCLPEILQEVTVRNFQKHAYGHQLSKNGPQYGVQKWCQLGSIANISPEFH